jgi:indolepyruvate decarboxylase
MPTVNEFLVERLQNLGIKNIFGGRGHYVNDFIKTAEDSNINFIDMADEAAAVYAADSYARLNGYGCICANYHVGALKLCSGIAGAYVERSPLIVISGSPAKRLDRQQDFMFNNLVKSFDNQYKIFKHLTCSSIILDDSAKAGYSIDSVLEQLKYQKKPVYLEIPENVANESIKYDVYRQGTPLEFESNQNEINEAFEEITAWIARSKNPLVLLGVEIARYDLSGSLLRFCEKNNIPFVSTLLGKSSTTEFHPLFAGIYKGNYATEQNVLELMEKSDCMMVFGEMPMDIGMEYQTSKFEKLECILCSTEKLRVKTHLYCNIRFYDFCYKLFKSDLNKQINLDSHFNINSKKLENIVESSEFTNKSFYKFIEKKIDENTVVVVDVNECLSGASEIKVSRNQFISPNFYRDVSFSLAGSLGVQLAKPEATPLVIMGIKAFKNVFVELETLLKENCKSIIFVVQQLNEVCTWSINNIQNFFGKSINVFEAADIGSLDSVYKTAKKSGTVSVIFVNLNS